MTMRFCQFADFLTTLHLYAEFYLRVAVTAIVATKKVAPIGIGLTAELLEQIDTQRGDLSRSLFVRRIIQDYYSSMEQLKESSVKGPDVLLAFRKSLPQKLCETKRFQNQNPKNDFQHNLCNTI
jgi:hypothetical protein